MNLSDLAEIVAELAIEMREVRNGRVTQLEQTIEREFRKLRQEYGNETRPSIGGLLEDFGHEIESRVNRVLSRKVA